MKINFLISWSEALFHFRFSHLQVLIVSLNSSCCVLVARIARSKTINAPSNTCPQEMSKIRRMNDEQENKKRKKNNFNCPGKS
jgi:hypothetical protein